MCNKYEKKLKDIIKKHHFDSQNFVDSAKVFNLLSNLFRIRCSGKNIALWGVGRNNTTGSHAAVIINKYATYLQGLSCLIDSCEELQGKDFYGLPIISPNHIQENNIDIIIVASRGSAPSIIESIKQHAPDCEYIDIYNELRKMGIEVINNFFEQKSLYTELYDLRISYEKENDSEKKADILHDLIAAYLQIRDFHYATYFINEYIKMQFKEYQKAEQMLSEIQELLNEIKRINQDKNDEIILFFIDSLRAIDVFETKEEKIDYKMFQSYLENAAVFTNAYSTAPVTYESMLSIINEIYPFEKNAYDNNFLFQFNEFPLLPLVKEKGMDINLYISEEYKIIHETKDINFIDHIHMSEKLWTLACNMAQNDNTGFHLLYFAWELHFPLMCGYHRQKPEQMSFCDVGIKDMSQFIKAQFADSLDYTNCQFDFYKEFISDDAIKAFFGDHSQVVYDEDGTKPYFTYYSNKDRATHVAFFISSNKVFSAIYPQLFSMIDFNKIMKQVVLNEPIVLPDKKIIQYQYYSVYNKMLRDFGIKNNWNNYINGIHVFMSLDYLYAYTAMGVEEVYRTDNPKLNIIDTLEGMKFADEIKEQFKIEFPDWLQVKFS